MDAANASLADRPAATDRTLGAVEPGLGTSVTVTGGVRPAPHARVPEGAGSIAGTGSIA